MDQIYEQTLSRLERVVSSLAKQVPQPKLQNFGDFCAFRYEERTIRQAIVQKLARMVSTLDGARLLHSRGFVQEQASLQRILGEIQEDIQFLVFGLFNDDHESSLHRDYLDDFFQEEFDADTAVESTQKRRMTPRKRIQAYLAYESFTQFDPSTTKELLRTVSKVYSGYVHAASPQLMDMYGPGSGQGKFYMRGMIEHPAYEAYRDDLRNYLFRSVHMCAISAKAFGDESLFEECFTLSKQYREDFPDLCGTG